jgi:hypothetical protein
MQQILVNEATNGDKRIFFYLVDATDGITPETLIVPSASELQYSQNGGSFTNFAGTWTEVGAGVYYYTPTAGEVNQMGILVFKLVKTGIRTYVERVQIVANDPYGTHSVSLQGGAIASGTFAPGAITATSLAADAGAEIADAVWDETMVGHTTVGTYGRRMGNWIEGQVLTSGSNTALTFFTNLSSVTPDFYKDALIRFETGALAGQVKKISAYNGATKFITVLTAFTSAPANTDQFSIENA